MAFEDFLNIILNIILNISVWSILRLFVLLSLLIFLVFGIVLVRQVKIMTQTFQTGLEFVLKVFAWLNLALVIAVFIVVLLFL